jgi:hypothetical protein
MLVRQVPLKSGVKVSVASISQDNEIQEALIQLGIPYPNSVIVLIGGAAGIGWWDRLPVRKAVRIVARLAEETKSVVLDGGMQTGIMAGIGKQRAQNRISFPLIGIASEGLSVKGDPEFVLDPNHTDFILTPGEKWGDESAWISKIATAIAGQEKSITVLVNGGQISKTDVHYSLSENRPVFVMRGTGRMADEIPTGEQVIPIRISRRTDEILASLRSGLT